MFGGSLLKLELNASLSLYIANSNDIKHCNIHTNPCKFEIFKVARYSFSGPIPPKFEHKLSRHKQTFGKIATTVVLDKDENLL